MSEGKIYAAISAVMSDVGAVGKNDKNDFDKYKYRGIDAVMNALSPAMVKNHVFVIPQVIESSREDRESAKGGQLIYSIVKVQYTFYTDDGSSVTAVVIGEAMDRSDKSTNKAMSAAFKYACFQTFCIPTDEMKDSEADSFEIAPNQKSAEPLNDTQTGYPSREWMLKVVKQHYHDNSKVLTDLLAAFHIDSVEQLTDAQLMNVYKKYA